MMDSLLVGSLWHVAALAVAVAVAAAAAVAVASPVVTVQDSDWPALLLALQSTQPPVLCAMRGAMQLSVPRAGSFTSSEATCSLC